MHEPREISVMNFRAGNTVKRIWVVWVVLCGRKSKDTFGTFTNLEKAQKGLARARKRFKGQLGIARLDYAEGNVPLRHVELAA